MTIFIETNKSAASEEPTVFGESYQDFFTDLKSRFPDASHYLNHDAFGPRDLEAFHADLRKIESGGFSHENVGGHYGRQQLSAGKALSRSQGYLALARLLQRRGAWRGDQVLFDALAGNGTFDRLMQKLVAERPRYVGNDVSITMVRQAHGDNRLVFHSDLRAPIVRDAFADYGVSAYGTHHVPSEERAAFIAAAGRRLKAGATLVIQDFLEGSATARWYSECIDQFRTYGHNYRHFEANELAAQLRDAGFVEVSEHAIYDPFVMPVEAGCSDDDARHQFYTYLIALFALDRLQRIVEQERLSVGTLDNLLSPYFRITAAEADAVRRDAANDIDAAWIEPALTIKTLAGARYLIAPRVAIAVAGTRPALI